MVNENLVYVNIGCANIYKQPTFHCEVISQVVLWERLKFIKQSADFALIVAEDNYEGWIHQNQIMHYESSRPTRNIAVTAPQVSFFRQASSVSGIIRDGVAGIRIPIIIEKDKWFKTNFPDGAEGWIETKNCGSVKILNRNELINYACSFLGVSYIWGGKTPKGFDCSGFTQFVHKMFGINLRRDAYMQYEDSTPVSKNPMDGQPGDLLFFSENNDRITHVGLCYKPGYVIHCQGMVKINSLNAEEKKYNEKLLKDFVEIRTFIY